MLTVSVPFIALNHRAITGW